MVNYKVEGVFVHFLRALKTIQEHSLNQPSQLVFILLLVILNVIESTDEETSIQKDQIFELPPSYVMLV